MSKYERLVSDWLASRQSWLDYREECTKTLRTIAMGLVNEYDIPQSCYKFVPINEDDRDQGQLYSLDAATSFGADDFWECGFQLTLAKDQLFEQLTLTMALRLKKEDADTFVFQLNGMRNYQVRVPTGEYFELEPILKFMDSAFGVFFSLDPTQTEEKRRIGFVSS